MKKNVLTLLGALAVLGLASCQTPTTTESSAAPASESAVTSGSTASTSTPAGTSTPTGTSTPKTSSEAGPKADATGHIWAADTNEQGDTETGAVAYKKAVTTTPATDKAVRFKVNESVVTLNSGSTRKSGTPEGYIKVTSDNMGFSFKLKLDKNYTGKLYLYGVMDGWSSNTGSSFFNNGTTQNTKIEVNGEEVDMSAQKGKTYLDYFGDGTPAGDNLSPEGYAPIGDVVLRAGVNTIAYTRVKTLNMLVKDFVFVVEEAQEWSAPTEVAATATTVAYKKYTNNFDGSVKIEFKATDGTLSEGAAIKDGTPAGYLKLDGNTQSMTYKFNLDANLDGKLYQRGMMDNYSGTNKSCTYYSQSKGALHGNFKATLNGSNVYFGDKKDVTYATMFGDDTQSIDATKADGTTTTTTYSLLKECEIGEGFLKNGENTFTYERVDSYNLTISDFVFIGKAASAHAALDETAEWKKDEISHWKEMPNDSFKWNRADNVWEADPTQTSIPATCTTPGKSYEKEAESGLTREVDLPIDPNAHTLTEGQKVADVTPATCECGASVYTMLKADASGDSDTTKKLGKATNKYSTYEITGAIPAGSYDVLLLGKTSDNNNAYSFKTRYVFFFGEDAEANYIQPNEGNYGDYGWDSNSEKWTNAAVATITVAEGATSLTVKYVGTGYSAFINGIRLTPHAAEAAPETPAENA